jgi:hypothetical protein
VALYWHYDLSGSSKSLEGYVLGHFMPGQELDVEYEDLEKINPRPELEFRDINGTEWQARSNGSLNETSLSVRVD